MTEPSTPILLVGAGGMLGRAFCKLLAEEQLEFRSVDLPEIDLADSASIDRALVPGTQTVINCAAFTDVDGAEDHEGAATAINGDGVGRLARRCADVGAVLVHYSTDYVFDGQAHEPYVAEHPRAPINAYGRSKARGEELLVAAGGPHILLRTSWLYAPWGKNFVLTMRDLTRSRSKLNVVADQVGRPTSAQYLARRSLELLRAEGRGTFHVTDGGMCSWYELAREVAAIVDADCRIEPCTSADFPRPAPRPAYSVLDLTRVESVLGPSRPWRENVRAVLAQVE